jgi:hypothetical protein
MIDARSLVGEMTNILTAVRQVDHWFDEKALAKAA